MENASLFLAGVDGIDVVLTGHQHLVFPGRAFAGLAGVDAAKGTLIGKPGVQAGFWGSHLGLIDLLLERHGDAWKIVSSTSEARPIYERDGRQDRRRWSSDEADVVAAVEADHEATLAYVRRPVGKTAAPLFSYFALVADDPSVQIVNQAQTWYVERDAEGHGVGGPAAPLRGGAVQGRRPRRPGLLHRRAGRRRRDQERRRPLPLSQHRPGRAITGAQVREWLERSAGIFNRIEPGKADQPLINPDFPSYNFDVIDGVTYRIDLSQPPRYSPKGELINPDCAPHRRPRLSAARRSTPRAKFVVATNNYRAGGGGNFPGING